MVKAALGIRRGGEEIKFHVGGITQAGPEGGVKARLNKAGIAGGLGKRI